jgi:hypothetical protein
MDAGRHLDSPGRVDRVVLVLRLGDEVVTHRAFAVLELSNGIPVSSKTGLRMNVGIAEQSTSVSITITSGAEDQV